MNDHYKKLTRMYLNAKINSSFYESTSLSIDEGSAVISLQSNEKYFHAMGAVHGSVYFKLLDDAAFFAAQSLEEDYFILTTSFEINLKRPIELGLLTAVGTFVKNENGRLIAKATLKNESGKVVADGIGRFAVGRNLLSSAQSYS